MSNTKHTPGPWIYDIEGFFADVNGSIGHPIKTSDGNINIAFVVSGNDAPDFAEAQINAELIASAPDLLKERDELKIQVYEVQKQYNTVRHSLDLTAPSTWQDAVNRITNIKARLSFVENEADNISDKNEALILERDKLQSLNAKLLEALKDSQACIDFGTNAYRTNRLLIEKIEASKGE